MRITGGEFKGRKLFAPKGVNTRPTSDAHREALYNILDNGMGHEYMNVLDLFSGSGALFVEALSRGANFICAFEKDKPALDCIKKNTQELHSLHEFDLLLLQEQKIEKWQSILIKKLPENFKGFDLVLCDPPYGKKLAERALKLLTNADGIISKDAVVYAELGDKEEIFELPGWECIKDRSKGGSRQLFYKTV